MNPVFRCGIQMVTVLQLSSKFQNHLNIRLFRVWYSDDYMVWLNTWPFEYRTLIWFLKHCLNLGLVLDQSLKNRLKKTHKITVGIWILDMSSIHMLKSHLTNDRWSPKLALMQLVLMRKHDATNTSYVTFDWGVQWGLVFRTLEYRIHLNTEPIYVLFSNGSVFEWDHSNTEPKLA